MDLELLGVIKAKKNQFERKGIYSIEELLRFIPRKYYDFREPKCISDLVEGEFEAVIGTIEKVTTADKYISLMISDEDGKRMNIIFFQCAYLKGVFQRGDRYIFCGKVTENVSFYTKQMQMANPRFSKNIKSLQKIIPIYSDIKGMSDKYLTEKIEKALSVVPKKEYLELDILNKYNLMRNFEMERTLHFPKTLEEIEEAKKRLVFDDLFKFALITNNEYLLTDKACKIRIKSTDYIEEFLKTLPFELTDGNDSQLGTVHNIIEKMQLNERTTSLVQGDVGCGKTFVALLLMIVMVENGYQAALMAPTTVLAQQHFLDISERLKPFGIKCVFLGGKQKAKEKRENLKAIEDGSANIVIGTHSVISESVNFNNLALAIVDEEHRFGVVQRKKLEKKSAEGIHTVTMSATPIPRSLAMTIYGDFVDVYTIKKMPQGRKAVKTKIETDSNKAYEFMYEEIKKGRQCYVVCPLIEDSVSEKMTGIQSTESEYYGLLSYFEEHKEVKIGQINGKMKQEEVDSIIKSFQNKEYDIIVSTTIIEVGVNVPNASVILIKNAERFGLAQLHQLRGRVGRGQYQSYCILHTEKEMVERLDVMTKTTDGFKIAEADLELRGMGDFIGTRQTGENNAVMLMIAEPDLYNKIKADTLEILNDEKRLPRYQFLIDSYKRDVLDEHQEGEFA